MKRIGAMAVIAALALMIFHGCKEDTKGVTETGLQLSFVNCLTFEAWVWVDSEYQGIASSEEPHFFELGEGSHALYVRSNAKSAENLKYVCWKKNFSISDGSITYMTLNCDGAECEDTLAVYPSH